MQLDFDLTRAAEPPTGPKVHSITELTRLMRTLIEGNVGEVWVEGEVSNFRRQASGHQYFTLKDAACQLPCVLFSGAASMLRSVKLADGVQIQAFGQVTVYEARGQYQMIVKLVQHRGEGALQAKFEALKRQLEAEGLFASERKRALPRFPRRVGVVTSPTGAALRDFLNVLHRRHPGIDVLINPVRVQGAGAAREIAQAIRDFGPPGSLPPVDVIVVTRGGGSIEDLWEFNEEVVARAIAESTLPVLSAIGHEIDFTIADFVADLRAPTPSAAAEILAADRLEVLAWLRQHEGRLNQTVRNRLDLLEAKIGALTNSSALKEPERRLFELRQSTDRHGEIMTRTTETTVERNQQVLHRLSLRLMSQSPTSALEQRRLRLDSLGQRIRELVAQDVRVRRARLEHMTSVMAALSPEGTLARGYTMTLDAKGKALTKAKNILPGTVLRTRFTDGEVESIAAQR